MVLVRYPLDVSLKRDREQGCVRPRKPSISYWPTRKGGGYFCIVKGERFELALGPDDQPTGATYRKAQDRFQEILEGRARAEAQERKRQLEPNRVTVREVLDAYLKQRAEARR